MSYNKCTLERFLKDVANHEMEIISENGVNRHIRFKSPSTRNMYFDLTTWGDHLCFSGDMGTYVFQRVEDMFTFFRRDEMPDCVNHYWDEKLESICTRGGRKEWNEDMFRESVYDHLKYYFDQESERDEQEELILFTMKELEYKDCSCHQLCWVVLDELEYEIQREKEEWEDIDFTDFWESASCDEYTYHYTWAQMAICWGVQQYDKFKNK